MKLKSFMVITLAWVMFGAQAFAAETEKNLQFAGQWPYHPAKAIAMDPVRNFIFLGDGDAITILTPDLVHVASIRATESSQIGGLSYFAAEERLYAACREDGLKVFDVSDVENPTLSGSWIPPDVFETLGLRVVGSTVYLCCGMDGLVIADISDMADPEVLSASKLPGGYGLSYAMDIHVDGNSAFAADLYNGIHIINITDPANPDYIKGIVLAGASDLDASSGYLYTTLQGSGTAILDITDPEDATLAALYSVGEIETAVRVDGDFAWIAYNPGDMRAVNISDKETPVHDPAWVYAGSGGSSLGLFPGGNAIYMADYHSGLVKIDTTDKTAMNSLAAFDTPADAVAIDVSGGYVYAVDDTLGDTPENEGLRIHELTTYSKSVQFKYRGFCPTPGTARDIRVLREYAYVADGGYGLQIISVSDPEQPEITGTCDTPGTASGVFVDATFAYVADGDQGLAIVDIADKSAPVIEGSLDTGGNSENVTVAGNYAYIADGSQGLKIINTTDKTHPVLAGACDTPGTASGVFVDGSYAYVADGSQGLAVIDITDPSAPALAASIDTIGFARSVMVSGDIAYVADGENGLVAIDITDPTGPIPEPDWSYDSPGIAGDVFSGYSNEAEELYAFIADGAAGVVA
ncbi:MAG: hypothetical protein COX19_16335, partial [Desulfobacterales bacterium CG23_combo_of_CG06-09_8_20_14_all_51_8]